jgi:hypothetical protein
MANKSYNTKLLAALMLAPAMVLGAETETAGNNLSFPVIWSDGAAKALRGEFGLPMFAGEVLVDEEGTWYLQQDEFNAWQAESFDAAVSGVPITVDVVDWGDNLEAKDWTTNSVVRVETVLYQDISTSPMLGFTMKHLWGEGVDEMWGTNTVEYDSLEATVYSGCARLTIQKLDGEPDERDLAWIPDAGLWEGLHAQEPDFIGGAWEGGDGPGYYSAEINIPGKVIYGYNWRVKQLHADPDDTAGDYRLTFSLNPFCLEDAGVALNTFFDAETQILVSEEEEVVTEAEDGDEDGETGGGVAVVDVDNNLTYIDVHIVEATGSGGGGGGGKGGPGGSGGGKGRPSR